MKRSHFTGTFLALTIATLVALSGCAKKTPLEQMVENRSRYSAELNESGFIVEETPLVAEVEGGEMDAESEPPAESETETDVEAQEMMEPEPVAVAQTVHLDILLRHDSQVKLPGVTVDITQVDSGLNQKQRWLVWLDTSKVERANLTQYGHALEDIDYVDGDAFSVELRHPIPEAERGDYKEFAEFE